MNTITIKAEDLSNLVIQVGDEEYRLEKVVKELPAKTAWVPRKGELIEVWDHIIPAIPNIREFIKMTEGDFDQRFLCRTSGSYSNKENRVVWRHCRPLSNTNILQFFDHDGGECPCPGERVRVWFRDGAISHPMLADSRPWVHANIYYDIIKYAIIRENSDE